MKQDALNVKDVNFYEISAKYCMLHLERRWEKKEISLNDKIIKRLIDMMTKSKNGNKKFNWKKIAYGVFNLKRAHVTIKHISCVNNFWRIHNRTILINSRKEDVNILDGNKESETNNRSEVVERCESQRSAEPVITEPPVSDNVKRTEEETKRVSEFNVNSNSKRHFEVFKPETTVISSMRLLSNIGPSVETMGVLTNSNVSKDGFFDAVLLRKNIYSVSC